MPKIFDMGYGMRRFEKWELAPSPSLHAFVFAEKPTVTEGDYVIRIIGNRICFCEIVSVMPEGYMVDLGKPIRSYPTIAGPVGRLP